MIYPTYIIGIGGTGEKILALIRSNILDKNLDYQQLRFLCFDVNEVRDEVSIESLYSYEYENIAVYYPEFIIKNCEEDQNFNKWWYDCKEWSDYQKASGEGFYSDNRSSTSLFSNFNRRIRRVCLFEYLRTNNFWRLFNFDRDNVKKFQPMRIIVVASLCGATGSGLFLDLGYILKHFFPDTLLQGILTLPELYSWKGNGDRFRAVFETNAYATIKEIEFFAKNVYEFGPAKHQIVFNSIEPYSDYWLVGNDSYISPDPIFLLIAKSVSEEIIHTGSLGYRSIKKPIFDQILTGNNWEKSYNAFIKGNAYSPHISKELDS